MTHSILKRPWRSLLLMVVFSAMLAGCTGLPRGVTPIGEFDARRYEGPWFEIMRLDHRFERDLSDVTATYRLRPDGSVQVINRGYDRKRCRWREIEGEAVFLGEPQTASLAVTFFRPFAGGYHVIALDRERYQWAMISGPTRGYLWILARQTELDPQVLERLIGQAGALGFRVEELIRVEHGQARCRQS
jgi:apolipoprotein D and lipocalin family protein